MLFVAFHLSLLIFSLSSFFVDLIIMCLNMFFLGYILYGTLCASWTWVTVSFPMLKKFSSSFRYFQAHSELQEIFSKELEDRKDNQVELKKTIKWNEKYTRENQYRINKAEEKSVRWKTEWWKSVPWKQNMEK